MKIKGAAFNPGFEAPKMGKNCRSEVFSINRLMIRQIYTYGENDKEQEIDVGNLVKLIPQVLRDKGQGCVFGSAYFVPAEIGGRMAVLISRIIRKG